MSSLKSVVMFFLFLLPVAIFGELVQPEEAGEKCHLTGGKTEWTYYTINQSGGITWEVSGPNYVKLYVRTAPSAKAEFDLFIDGEKYKNFEVEEGKSSKYKIRISDGKSRDVTTARTIRIKIADGQHAIRLTSSKNLFARLTLEPKRNVSIAPESYEKSLSLVAGDSKTTYYMVTMDKPAILEYSGQAVLTVWNRLAFDKNMKGAQHYEIVIAEEGKKPIRARFETVISETSRWENDGDVIPGKARTHSIKLGKGNHHITVWPDKTAAPYCAIRFTVTR